jgi:hypothetical protein
LRLCRENPGWRGVGQFSANHAAAPCQNDAIVLLACGVVISICPSIFPRAGKFSRSGPLFEFKDSVVSGVEVVRLDAPLEPDAICL